MKQKNTSLYTAIAILILIVSIMAIGLLQLNSDGTTNQIDTQDQQWEQFTNTTARSDEKSEDGSVSYQLQDVTVICSSSEDIKSYISDDNSNMLFIRNMDNTKSANISIYDKKTNPDSWALIIDKGKEVTINENTYYELFVVDWEKSTQYVAFDDGTTIVVSYDGGLWLDSVSFCK